MKGNIGKLSILLSIPVVTLFIMVVSLSAGPAIPYGINGEYAVTGFSTCDAANPGILELTYTFRNDGTGSFSGYGRNLLREVPDVLRCAFTYTVTKEGRIEFLYPYPPGGIQVGHLDENEEFVLDTLMDAGPSHGYISPDHKTITISCGPPLYLTVIDPGTGKPVFGPVWCVTSFVGMRIK